MELILKTDNSIKMAKVMALAKKLGITVVQKDDTQKKIAPVPPKGKTASVTDLLEAFGKDPDFPSTEQVRSKSWPSAW
ncbi:hypothetical protein BDE36_3087 [Arcticibacter tournemirensis]|uniref:Uncharacterized protein n=1 Tax=Arcticibacter tournemirensis TaxID=699437 RepID=A0A5M9GUN7_9SPHI|nr:hypothetical protein [Arcticibacter tournemirensis]KAA8477485.1 hypothetical protein F1649_18775 [Arcticibacter tournemirensis]TQM51310.1 hypothetical protein BDE36_3087 [Arcticibacter tournemirensis]